MNPKSPPVHYTVKRFNYASSECGAKVLRTNPEAREVSAVVSPSKDRYMLNPCSAPNKYLVIELCEQIGIDTIVIGTFEYFSSLFKDFQVLGSNQFPMARWELLGNFTASNIRDLQKFTLSRPAWYKYLKIKLLTHYGNEFYCPISKIKVYGVTLVEQLKEQFELDSNELRQLQETLKYEEVHIGSLGSDHNLIEKDTLELGSVTDIGDDDDDDDDDAVENSKDSDGTHSLHEIVNQIIEHFETSPSQTKLSTPPLNSRTFNNSTRHRDHNIATNNNDDNLSTSQKMNDEQKLKEKDNDEVPSVLPEGDKKVIILNGNTVHFNDEDNTNTTIEESQNSKLSATLFSKLASRVKALEIQQSLIDSRIEKMASKTIEKIDELQRLFVILQKRIKEHKKLLQRLEEQRDSLRQHLHDEIESKAASLYSSMSQMEEKITSKHRNHIIGVVFFFILILSIFMVVSCCTFYHSLKNRAIVRKMNAKLKKDTKFNVNTSIDLHENKKLSDPSSRKKTHSQNTDKIQRIYALLGNGQQQQRAKKEREKRMMELCGHSVKDTNESSVNRSSFF